MEHFTPLSGFIGGLMIGVAASLFVLVNGRIAGISGVLGGLLGGAAAEWRSQWLWRMLFVVGIVAGPLVVARFGTELSAIDVNTSIPILIVSGLLVGFGTRLGSGCTSGHGVCGLARGSRRSIVATVTFFGVAAATVFVIRHLLGE